MNLYEKDFLLKTFLLVDEVNDEKIINSLLEDVLKNNIYYHKPTNVVAKHTKFSFLNENENFYNFLKSIKKQIHSIFKSNFRIIEAWANIYNQNDYTRLHHHRQSDAFSGILYLTDSPGPGTYFPEYDLTIHEKKGRFVLFHGYLSHEVKKFNYTKDRITIAFNCGEVGYEDKNTEIKIIR